jgi:hypothetical protein
MQCRLLIPPLNLKMRRTRRRKTQQVVLEAMASAACISCACFSPGVVHMHVRERMPWLLNYMFATFGAASKPIWRRALEKALKSNK